VGLCFDARLQCAVPNRPLGRWSFIDRGGITAASSADIGCDDVSPKLGMHQHAVNRPGHRDALCRGKDREHDATGVTRLSPAVHALGLQHRG